MLLSYFSDFKEVITSTLTITCLVMVMMLLIEFVNVSSSGKLIEKLQNKPYLQIILATLLGLIPGCIGGFTIVSLFTHRLISFGALVAGMISTFGDEAFVIFAYSPKLALQLSFLLFIIGITTGFLTDLLFKNKRFKWDNHHFEIHEKEVHHHTIKRGFSISNLKVISYPRLLIMGGLILYIIAILTGFLSHQHGGLPVMDHLHHHAEHYHEHTIFSWENVLFLFLAISTLTIVALSSEHFVSEHLWDHVVKKHFISVLLWTFGVLLLLKIVYLFVDINVIMGQHSWTLWILLLLAILIGVIPESGPHLIFVVLFINGSIPFSILLVSSIVQDGHGALPLLASSRSNFFLMKSINMLAGLVVGLLGMFLGF